MAIGLGFKGGVLGIGEEGVWGTAVACTKFLELISGKITKNITPVDSKAIPKIYNDDDEHTQGGVKVEGAFELEMRYEGAELLFKHAMGTVTTTEVASFEVTASNKYFDFDIGGGELTATITTGTYAMGASQVVAGSLCKAIYDAIVAAEAAGTYTVTFSVATKKVTITRSAGTFSILWKTGTHGADGTDTHIGTLIGYSDTANDTAALSYTADSAVVSLYNNVFTLADELPTGLTLEIDEDIKAATSEGSKLDSMGLSVEYNNFLKASFGFVGEDKTYDTATAATLPTAALVTFAQGAITGTLTTNKVISAKVNLNNKLKKDIVVIGQRTIEEPTRGGKREVTGSISIYFQGTDEYDAFVADTSKSLTLTFTGGTIKTGFTYTVTITIPVLKITGATPNLANEGPITLDLPFKAYATDSTTKEMSVTIRNTVGSV